MDWLRRIQRTCSGLVAALMLWSAAMPALALALNGPPGSPGSWVEVCTSRGTLMLKRVVFEAAVPIQTDEGLASSLTHCPYCPTAGLESVIPSATYAWVTVASSSEAIALSSLATLAASHRWTLPPNNGPPNVVA